MKRITLYLSISILIWACSGNLQQANDLLEEGITFENAGRVDTALACYNKAIGLFAKAGDKELTGDTYNRIGSLYLNNELYQDAQKAFHNGLKNNLSLKDKTQASKSYIGIGNCFAYQLIEDSALYYQLLAYKLIEQVKDSNQTINIYNNLAATYLSLAQYDETEKFVTQTLQLAKDSTTIYRCYSIKADIFIAYHQYDSALVYLKKGILSNNIYTKTCCYLQLSELAKQTGDSDYINYLETSSILKDSIEQLNKSWDIVNADKQSIRKHATQKIQRLFKVGIPIILFLILGGSSFFFLQRKRHQHKILAEKQHTQEANEELQKMKEELSKAQKQHASQEELAQKQQAIQNRSNTLIKEIKKTGVVCCTEFMKSESYANIKEKDQNKALSFSVAEVNMYRNCILNDFKSYITQLTAHVPLTPEEAYLCCLLLLGLSTKTCAGLRCVTDSGVRIQKGRIRKKTNETFLSDTSFDKLFPHSQK